MEVYPKPRSGVLAPTYSPVQVTLSPRPNFNGVHRVVSWPAPLVLIRWHCLGQHRQTGLLRPSPAGGGSRGANGEAEGFQEFAQGK
jgi:hypothetical protein